MSILSDNTRVHFIGIGGVGMSGIALIAASRGMAVSGSDLKDSRALRALASSGVHIEIGHKQENLSDPLPDIVVISSAIPETNPELSYAREKGLKVWPRAKMLAALGVGKKTLAVAGTHGKTTTSSMLATTLDRLLADPTFLIGGTVNGYNTNAKPGAGDYYVVEADESDGSFVYLDPHVAIVTNIEEDHLDHYADLAAIDAAFLDFVKSVPEDGVIVVCGQNERLPKLFAQSGRKVLSYGFGKDCDVWCDFDEESVGTPTFSVNLPDGEQTSVTLAANPGRHNALNATGVMAALWFLGFDAQLAANALSAFSGVRRRFDRVGSAFGIDIVDDYGHHPTEVKATISAASALGYRHLHILFQPHRYSRTEALARQFGDAFDLADSVTFMDVYSAGERPTPGISGKTLVDAVLSHDPRAQVGWMPHRSEVVPYLMSRLMPGDLMLTMGAGDVTDIGPVLLEELQKEEKAQ